MRLLSLPIGRITPIIFLVILPALTIMSTTFMFTPNAASEFPWAIGFTMIITVFATYIGFFYYGVIRPHYFEKYLKQGLEQAIIEFETVKKLYL
jgi:hypothetical protein